MPATFLETGAFGQPAQTGGSIPKGLNQAGVQDRSNFVPDGEVWQIHAASVGQMDPGTYVGLTLALHLELDLGLNPAGVWQGIHLFALTEQRDASRGTPFLALDRPILLLPQMRLGVRFNSPPATLQVSLMAYGFRFPMADLDRLLLASAAAASGAGPDLSAVYAAAQAAAQALTTLAGSRPA